MHFIGITGGVGCGKSQIMDYVETRYGAYCLKTDLLAKQMMEKGGSLYDQVVSLFGSEILMEDGGLNRKKIAGLVFADQKLLQRLNQLTHPAVKREILRQAEDERKRGREWFFLESALAIEEKYNEICDQLWYVYADENVRRERLKASRGYSDEKMDSVMANQMDEKVFRRTCDFVIDNSGSFEKTKKQIDERIASLRS